MYPKIKLGTNVYSSDFFLQKWRYVIKQSVYLLNFLDITVATKKIFQNESKLNSPIGNMQCTPQPSRTGIKHCAKYSDTPPFSSTPNVQT